MVRASYDAIQSCSYNAEYSYFDILPMSKSLVTSKIFNLDVFYQVCFPCGGVPLDPTLLPNLRLYGRLKKSGTNIHKKWPEKYGLVSPPRQDVIHPGLSGSRGRLDLGYYMPEKVT